MLFVCGGNTCRSPMAAALARHLFGERVVAESAGVDAGPLPVSGLARTTLQKDYGITISEQQARDVEDVSLAEFDRIVALDHWIADELRDRHHVALQRILVWAIADPYMNGRAEYAAVAECIKNELIRHERELLSPLHGQTPATQLPVASYEAAVSMLLERIASWRELLAGHDPGPTHRSGIVTKAFDTLFVQAFRQRLSAWLSEQHMDAEAVKEKAGAEQALERSPLGTVVAYLKAGRKLNAPLADAVPPHAVKLLDRLPSLRNQLVKPEDYQAPTVEETLRALDHVEEALKAAAEFFMPAHKYAIHRFGPGIALNFKTSAPLLAGTKSALLAELASIGLPVPPGFTIPSALHSAHCGLPGGGLPERLDKSLRESLGWLEDQTCKMFGNPENPLLVSVRCSRPKMPGVQDTILNLGLNDAVVTGLAMKHGSERFAWDAYRRFIQQFGTIVLGLSDEHFDKEITRLKSACGARQDIDLTAGQLREITGAFLAVVLKHSGRPFPQDPFTQLHAAVRAASSSWNSRRVVDYRKMFQIASDDWSAQVHVQSMVFGNLGEGSGVGTCYTRDPKTGEKCLEGEWLPNAQGDDAISGIRTSHPITGMANAGTASLADSMPDACRQMRAIGEKLERHYGDMQAFDFTIENGNVFVLASHTRPRSGLAEIRIAVDLVREGLLDEKTVAARLSDERLNEVVAEICRKQVTSAQPPDARGLGASPGAVTGGVAFSLDSLVGDRESDYDVIFVGHDLSPDQYDKLDRVDALLMARGGKTSHAAVVARGRGFPCVVGCTALSIGPANTATLGDHVVREGDLITMDGHSGSVYIGAIPIITPKPPPELETILEWKRRSAG